MFFMPLVAPGASVVSQLDGDFCNPELLWAFHLGQFALSRLDPCSSIVVVGPDVVNTAIHHVLILPLVGHSEDKSLAFAFASQNELMTESGNTIVWFLDSVHLTCPTHACGK
ncbi:hypothetical protein DSO57_1023648 [Entomophthora muscae]|uniref:Uncharacterized protein n=1 Tax=Entomophthora muscae TaxID=34485 RepID=A0ACC2RHM2_9FUNG|nr:hypothetical protein DSO57_1023648 [Entomophthora muscae]